MLVIGRIADDEETTHDEYMPITTQIFDDAGPCLEDDCVFAVKESLLVTFRPRQGDPKATLEVEYDFKLKKEPRKLGKKDEVTGI